MSKELWSALKDKLIIITLKSGEFNKGKLVDFDDCFLKLQTLKAIRLIAVNDISHIREVQNDL